MIDYVAIERLIDRLEHSEIRPEVADLLRQATGLAPDKNNHIIDAKIVVFKAEEGRGTGQWFWRFANAKTIRGPFMTQGQALESAKSFCGNGPSQRRRSRNIGDSNGRQSWREKQETGA